MAVSCLPCIRLKFFVSIALAPISFDRWRRYFLNESEHFVSVLLNPNDPPDSCCFFKVSQNRLRVLVADCVKVGAEGSVCGLEVYCVKTPYHSVDYRAKA